MSRPLIPRPSSGEAEINSLQPTQKPRKISTACGACKQRKTRVTYRYCGACCVHHCANIFHQCSGTSPCDACASRGSLCSYDVASDQRRKIANQRNLHDLVETQTNLERHQQLLGGIVAILRMGDIGDVDDLLAVIRSGVDLSQLAAHVRNARRANPAVDEAFAAIDFVIDGVDELPSPSILLGTLPSQPSTARNSVSEAGENVQSSSTPAKPYIDTELQE